MMRPDFRRLLAVFLILAAFLIASAVALYWIGLLSIRANQALLRETAFVAELGDLLSTVRDAETSQRGYLLTGNPQYLVPYDQAVARVRQELDHLQVDAPKHAVSAQHLEDLNRWSAIKLEELQRTIKLYQEGHRDQALAIVNTGQGMQTMDQIRNLTDALIENGNRRIQQLTATTDARTRFRTFAYIFLGGMNLLALAWAFRRIHEQTLQQRAHQSALWDAKLALEAANNAKDQFLATLSHELRTPLTPVLVTLSTWETSDDLPAPFLSDVQMLRRNIELEAKLIDDLLDVTRIVKGKFSLTPETVNAHELLQVVTAMYRDELQVKSLRLSTSLQASRHFVRADPARLQQIFWNIIKNAIKFTPEQGAIQIATANDPQNNLLITFTDSGIGMSANTLSRLFQPFQQGSDDIARQYGGLGLGMAISKALMDALGGTISAVSAGPGRGASFTITLPTIEAPSPSDAPALPSQAKTSDARRRLNILLVEDHTDTARAMTRLLGRMGHQVQSSDTVAGALALVQNHPFDLMISDISLPDGTGIDLIHRVRERHPFPAIALTGFGMEHDIERCLQAGFTTHLTKPVSFQKLEILLEQFVPNNAN